MRVKSRERMGERVGGRENVEAWAKGLKRRMARVSGWDGRRESDNSSGKEDDERGRR